MADELDVSEESKIVADPPQSNDGTSTQSKTSEDKPLDKVKTSEDNQKSSKSSKSDRPQPKRFPFPKIGFPNIFPKLRLPKIGLGKSKSPSPSKAPEKPKSDKKVPKKKSFLWLWLIFISISYTCLGYFLSVLLTAQKNLAIAGFAVSALLPTVNAFADYKLAKWGYFLSGFLVVGWLFYLGNIKLYLMIFAIVLWMGMTAMAGVGELLLKQKHKLVVAIGILTLPCVLGLAAGWQIWYLLATLLS